jgi:hypothetical protein
MYTHLPSYIHTYIYIHIYIYIFIHIQAIRIANNMISNVSILVNPFQTLFDTSKIMWLDISFNHIEDINPIIFELFPNVTALYLQSNQIKKLSEIRKLENFRFLKSLAIYGNPIEEHKHYRNYILFYCKLLTNFDMSPVTKSERTMVSLFVLAHLANNA